MHGPSTTCKPTDRFLHCKKNKTKQELCENSSSLSLNYCLHYWHMTQLCKNLSLIYSPSCFSKQIFFFGTQIKLFTGGFFSDNETYSTVISGSQASKMTKKHHKGNPYDSYVTQWLYVRNRPTFLLIFSVNPGLYQLSNLICRTVLYIQILYDIQYIYTLYEQKYWDTILSMIKFRPIATGV